MSSKWSRRQFAATALASIAAPALAGAGGANASAAIRPASISDIPQLVRLLLAEAQGRARLDPVFWPLAPEAEARIAESIRTELEAPAAVGAVRLWRVAEAGGRIVGVAHAAVLAPPGAHAAPMGLLLDDCVIVPGAPPGAAEALLLATEAALQEAGAKTLMASCPQAGAMATLYDRAGYRPAIRYLGKAGLSERPLSARVRPATPADAPGLVGFWMRASLPSAGQDMFVAGDGGLGGFVVARPDSSPPIPAGHASGSFGMIEDFCATDLADPDGAAVGLLSAAESALASRGRTKAIAACPATSTSTVELLSRSGYRTTRVWMLKA